jgi:hypothetical protein
MGDMFRIIMFTITLGLVVYEPVLPDSDIVIERKSQGKSADADSSYFDLVSREYLSLLNIQFGDGTKVCHTMIEHQRDGTFLTVGYIGKRINYIEIYLDKKKAKEYLEKICKDKCSISGRNEYITGDKIRIGVETVPYKFLKDTCVSRALYPRNHVFWIRPIYYVKGMTRLGAG